MATHREEVIAHLRWLADQPGGVPYRAWLYDAALMLSRDDRTVWVSSMTPNDVTGTSIAIMGEDLDSPDVTTIGMIEAKMDALGLTGEPR